MNLLDIFILLFLLAAIVRGLEVGFVRQFFSTAGFFVGLFLGVWLQSLLIHLVRTPEAKAILVLSLVLCLGLGLMTAGEYVGLRIKFKLKESPVIERIDSIMGSVLAGITLLAAIWLGVAIFRNAPFDGWRREVSGSRILASLGQSLPSAPNLLTRIGYLLDPNGFPHVFSALEPKLPADMPLPDMGELNSAVLSARPSIVKVEGEGCGGVINGSGFIAAKNLVVTNAHVVAGVHHPYIIDQAGEHASTPIWFDPDLDLAILRGDLVNGRPLPILPDRAASGTPVAVAGYPGDKGFTAGPGVIVDSFTAYGYDIYNLHETARDIYSIKAQVEHGNSGGPLLTKDGTVAGIVFAKSYSYDSVGYALITDKVIKELAEAQHENKAVSTGVCPQ